MSERALQNGSSSWAAQFRERAARERLPVSIMLELTTRCNFRCRHCYQGDRVDPIGVAGPPERSTEQILTSLAEWVEAGCLYLTLTGGDPMMHADFARIYRAAAELGVLITVFCNGSLVTGSMVALFKQYPPRLVEVSLYGATPEVYEAVTRSRGSFERAWRGIRLLHAAGVRLSLKAPVLTLNEHEIEAMAEQAEALGCPFRYDGAIFPTLDGDESPLRLRVSPEELARHDVAVVERRERWAEHIEARRAQSQGEMLYECGAGLTSLYVDAHGALSPCLMARTFRCDPGDRPFEEVWRSDLARIRQVRRKSTDSSTLTDKHRGACSHCPAMNALETGDEQQESDYMKHVAHARYERVMA